MTDRQRRAYVWCSQDRKTLAEAAEEMGVDTIRARQIYDDAMEERLGRCR